MYRCMYTRGMTKTLIGQTARPFEFSNPCWNVTKPAGTHVQICTAAIESGARYVYAYLPGTRYSAILPASAVQPI